MAKAFRDQWFGKEFYYCCAVCSRSGYADFLVWCTELMVEKYNFDGIYLDGGYPNQCDSTEHGCGYQDAFGRWIQPWNDLPARNLYRRIYQTIHSSKPDGFLYTHGGCQQTPHVHSMVDLLLPGEDLMPMVPANPNYYTDFVPLVRWQSTYNISPIIGTAAVFHGLSQPPAQPPNVAPSDPDISTPLFTMCLLHDINPNGAHIYCKTIDRFWQMRRDSGIAADGTKFVGYWYPNAAFKSDNKSILVSHYEPAEGAHRVVIIGNISKEPQSFTLQAPPGWRASLANAHDAFTKEKVDASKPLELKKRGYLVIELSKPK